MQELLLGYILQHPEEALKTDESIFVDENYFKVFCELKDRVINKKATTAELVAKGAKTILSPLNLKVISSEHFISKAEFEERKEEWIMKQRLSMFDKMFSDSFRDFTEVKEPKDKLQALIKLKEKISKIDTSLKKYEVKRNPNLANEWLENYDNPIVYKAKTGFPTIDNIIGGLKGTELAIIIADTGIGKTNLLLNFAKNILESGKSILFFSLEMGDDELLDRFIPILGGHNAYEIRNKVTQKETLHGTVQKLKGLDLSIVYSGGITSDDVVSEIINQQPVDIVMVDYLQRLNDDKGRDTEMERLRSIVRKLKNAALNLRVPIITPVQVDKASSKSGAIRVENVAGAKDIANEADLALYLYEKEIENKSMIGTPEVETRLRIVKSRHSQKGMDIKLKFDKTNLRMTEDDTEKNINSIINFFEK